MKTADDLFDLMVKEARFSRDRCSMGSDGHQAKALGVSRTTIWRWKRQLRDSGRIAHGGYHVWNQRLPSGHPKRTARWVFPDDRKRLRETQRSSSRKTTRPCTGKYNAYGKTGSRRCAPYGRRRRMMEQPELFGASAGVVRKDGVATAFNAADAVATVCDLCASWNIKIPPTLRARLGKAAKTCIEDGYDPVDVISAMVISVRRGRVDLVESILLDMQTAKTGQYMSFPMYRKALEGLAEMVRLREGNSPLDRLILERVERAQQKERQR